MRKLVYTLLLFISVKTVAQNKQILYNFDKIPQNLLLNPGAETTYKYHIGIPLLSGISASVNTSGITIADVFRDDGISFFKGVDFNTKFKNAMTKLDKNDYAYFNAQVEVLSGGYKINTRDYLSAGFYSEADVFFNIPKDIITLMTEGNVAHLNKVFSLSQVNVRADVLGVLHFGLSRRLSNRFMAGTRLKIYSGSLNVTSIGNEGTFSTKKTASNVYQHSLNAIDGEVNSSGIYDENDEANLSAGSIIGGTFLGGNFGLGLDVGFTFYASKQLQYTASILDIGFVSYSKQTRNAKVQGNYNFSGIDFKYNETSKNYLTELKEDFKKRVPSEDNRQSYSVMRPIKVNGSVRYSFGKSRSMANCHDASYKDFYDNAVGGQIYTVFRPNGPRLALTGFYERKFSKHLNTKFTYTVDDFSSTNFGAGMSINIWKLNVYGMVDNIFSLTDVVDSHRTSFQFGINLVYN